MNFSILHLFFSVLFACLFTKTENKALLLVFFLILLLFLSNIYFMNNGVERFFLLSTTGHRDVCHNDRISIIYAMQI